MSKLQRLLQSKSNPTPPGPGQGQVEAGPGPSPHSTQLHSITSSLDEYGNSVNSSGSAWESQTSSTPFFPDARTPNNTAFQPGENSLLSQHQHHESNGTGELESTYSWQERIPLDGSRPAPIPLQHLSNETPLVSVESISPNSSFNSTQFLLPKPLNSNTSDPIPHSNRPIPGPLSSLSSSTSNTTDPFLTTPSTETTSIATTQTPPNVKLPLDLSAAESRLSASGSGSGGFPKGQEDRDAARLRQLGYDAVLGRDYTFWSSLSISWLNIGALQGTIYAVSGCYAYGGPAMILVAWPVSGVFCFFLTLTLSELASAYPVSGAMSSWAWKLARGGVGGERGWAWLMGGFMLLVIWEIVNIIAGTMAISFDYKKTPWHMFLFFIAVLLIVGSIGSTAWGRSHRFWLCSGIFGFTMWAVLCITLLATNATKHRSGHTFTTFYNTTGWSSKPYVYLLGWQFTTIASGADASAHMAEETQNPSRNVPNAMTASVILTYVLGYISIILLLLSIAPEDAATVRMHSFPFGFILTKAISEPGAISVCCLMIVVLHLQVIAQLQASSRFVFALARDNAMPFSDWIRRTNESKNPVFANWLVIALCLPFACMTLGSQATLYSVLAVTACTMSYTGYIVPVGLYLVSKKNLLTEGRTTWSLGKASKPVAVIGFVYGLTLIIAQTFPGSRPVTAATMSWSPVIIAGTIILCFLTWRSYGAKHYSGPIKAVTKWETGMEIDLSTTLGSSRSRPSHGPRSDLPTRGSTAPVNLHRGVSSETDSSLKLALEPHMPSVVHTISIETGHTDQSQNGALNQYPHHGQWSTIQDGNTTEWTTDSDLTSSGGTVRSGERTPTTSRI
uniref:Amino acid/metabolite permease n=1 Tax=Kwoniella dejecticola CBS 10117 TaxID=1296121 RepID=A0A1A6A9C4_9TREE|nr:amino acid/metabolite permease [Kwoniella dejecticola CBS 10117]OBR86659.1 amino acid/metabolite permease [Kwoniella dejecticola CBS 10117]